MRLRPVAAVVAAAVSVSALSLAATPALADGAAVSGIVSTTSVPQNGVAAALSPDGATAYVLSSSLETGTSSLSAVSIATGVVGYKVKIGFLAATVAIAPDGSALYVGGLGGLAVISTSRHAITAEPKLPKVFAKKVLLSPDGSTLYVDNTLGSIDAFSTSGLGLQWSAVLPAMPTTLAESPDGTALYATSSNPLGTATTVYAIPTTATAPATQPAATTLATILGGETQDLAVSADGTTVYAADYTVADVLAGHDAGALVPVTVATNAVGSPLPITGVPQVITATDASSVTVLSANLTSETERLTTVNASGTAVLGSTAFFGEYDAGVTAAPSAAYQPGTHYLLSDDGKLAAFGTAQQLGAPASVSYTGTARVGLTVTAHPGTWTPGTTLKYQWFDEDGTIPGATHSTYKVPAAEKGYKLAVAVIGTQPGYVQGFATSKAVTVAAGKLATKPVSIVGTVKVGKTVKTKHGAWTSGTKFTVQWYANGKAIKGAKKSTLKISAALAGKKLTAKLTGAKTGYAPVTVTSKAKLVPKAKKK